MFAGEDDPSILFANAADAPCRGQTAMFFATDAQVVARAIEVCESCPARLPCLSGAVDRREANGVWGGFCFDDLSSPRRYRRARVRLRQLLADLAVPA